MRWWNHSWLARVVVVALLLWTAADLTNASLCALDSDTFNGAVSAAATVTDSTGANTGQADTHIDDCFCCSHCVDMHVLMPTIAAALATLHEPTADVAVPDGARFPLYHPPLV